MKFHFHSSRVMCLAANSASTMDWWMRPTAVAMSAAEMAMYIIGTKLFFWGSYSRRSKVYGPYTFYKLRL